MELFQLAKPELVAVFPVLNQVVEVDFIEYGAACVGVRWDGEEVRAIIDDILFLHSLYTKLIYNITTNL